MTRVDIIALGSSAAGGALLYKGVWTSDEGVLEKIAGSWMVVQVDTIEAAWCSLKKDPYYSSGEVWDQDKLTVTPVYVAIPKVD